MDVTFWGHSETLDTEEWGTGEGQKAKEWEVAGWLLARAALWALWPSRPAGEVQP